MFARALPVISAFMSRGVPEGEPVVLDVAQLEALLGAAEASAVAAEAIAAERGIPAADIAAAEGLALHAAAFNGMPDPVFHLAGPAMTIVTGLAAIEPAPDAPSDVILDAALQAATGLQQLLSFRHACTTRDQRRRTAARHRYPAVGCRRTRQGRRGCLRPHRAGQAGRRVAGRTGTADLS